MPGIVKVRIVEARDLPIMDRASEMTDAFVVVKFHERYIFKTNVCPKTLCPKWNSDWFTFEVDDDQIQDELLQIKVFDKDTVTANDPIGKVHISLVPLTGPNSPSVISGWFPIFDTLHGIRGQIKLIVKVKYFSDSKQCGCGVKFFYSDTVPSLYKLIEVKSFVEELVIEDDPEYKWIDKIRTSRASNDARQLLFLKLAATLQRKIGTKVRDLGGNAVIGYRLCFDLEGSFGVVVRAIGTCVTIADTTTSPDCSPLGFDKGLFPEAIEPEFPAPKNAMSRQTSRSKNLSCNSDTSEQNCFPLDSGSPVLAFPIPPPKIVSNYADFPFYTMATFPSGFISNMGGVVTSRSVKLLDKLESMPEESDTRDKLWLELRKEIRAHMKTLECNAVVGYSEQSTICDKLCVLSATGTAVVINPKSLLSEEEQPCPCEPCHTPYNINSSPFTIAPQSCAVCGTCNVPEIMLTTVDYIPDMPITGNGCFIHAQAFRTKKKQTGENSAQSIGQQLPFLEYELHTQLTQKLRIKGMNAILGLRYELCVGDTAVCCIATGTAVFFTPLPPASILEVQCPTAQSDQANSLQHTIQKVHDDNITSHNLTSPMKQTPDTTFPDTKPDLYLNISNKEVVIVDIEDPKDERRIKKSLECPFPKHMYTSNTPTVPGIGYVTSSESSHIFTQICRIDIPETSRTDQESNTVVDFDAIIQKNIQLLCFKVRKYKTCFLSNIKFHVHMPDEDELVIVITAIANICSVVSPVAKVIDSRRRYQRFYSSGSNELRFCEEDMSSSECSFADNDSSVVQITTSNHIPGGVLKACYGHINMFLIRESSDVRHIGAFIKNFIMESQAIIRAHVASLGGNVLFGYRVRELVLIDGPQKLQAQILLNICGDAANVQFNSPVSQTTSTM